MQGDLYGYNHKIFYDFFVADIIINDLSKVLCYYINITLDE